VRNVEFIAANSDAQDLRRNKAHVKIQIGERLKKGLGVGGNPVEGRKAAEESVDVLREVIEGADMVFITAGMGGGTGTGAAPLIAKIAKDRGALTVGVVSRPFEYEGRVRAQQAESGISEIRQYVDTLLVIPNEKLFSVINDKTTTDEAFHMADDVLRHAVQAITDVITRAGEINVDFADVRTIMTNAGEALMGVGEAEGSSRAIEAAKLAIDSPLLENVVIDGAKGVLVNITGSRNVRFMEIKEAMTFIHSAASHEAHVFYGQAFDETLNGKIKVTVIATGFPPRNGKVHSLSRPETRPVRRFSQLSPDLLKSLSIGMPSQAFGQEKPSVIRAGAGLARPMGDSGASFNLGSFSSDDLLKKPAYLRVTSRKLK
ncbi:MAG: cell division protein FtsZ, partial [Elusimicrobia bacterium]|nr:cell division protein FtsZ [Elusimicrobiota bacterium]